MKRSGKRWIVRESGRQPVIDIDRGLCPFCSHNKHFSCLNENSANFNRRKCSRCKRWY